MKTIQDNQNLVKEVSDLANSLILYNEDKKLTFFEALQIAVKMQQNDMFEEAFMIRKGGELNAFETIADIIKKQG